MAHLLDLPAATLDLVMRHLPPAEACRLGHTGAAAKVIAHAAHVWSNRLQQYFPEAAHVADPPLQRFADLAVGKFGLPCPCELGCGGSLLRLDGVRCPCVAARTRLPLRLGSLAPRRSGSSALSGGGFTVLLATLRRHFDFKLLELEELADDALSGLDMLILCTTEGPPLAEAELEALRKFVVSGGALIASAFSNWSQYRHYAAATVGWLGIQTMPRAPFMGRGDYDLTAATAELDGGVADSLLTGPFGHVDTFINQGESYFTVQDAAIRQGAVRLAGQVIGQDQQMATTTLVFYPPGRCWLGARGPLLEVPEGITGAGRVLVCSNLHWLADTQHWNGGLFAERCKNTNEEDSSPQRALRPNQALLLNFAAGAVAARAGGAHGGTMLVP